MTKRYGGGMWTTIHRDGAAQCEARYRAHEAHMSISREERREKLIKQRAYRNGLKARAQQREADTLANRLLRNRGK